MPAFKPAWRPAWQPAWGRAWDIQRSGPITYLPFTDTISFITHLPGDNTPINVYTNAGGTTPATADGDVVASWRRTDGVLHTLTNSGVLKIIGGVPVVRFNGTNNSLTVTGTFNLAHRFQAIKFKALTTTSISRGYACMAPTAGNDSDAGTGTAIATDAISPGSIINKTCPSILVPMTTYRSSGNAIVKINGVQVGTASDSSSGTAQTLVLGARIIAGVGIASRACAVDIEMFTHCENPTAGKIAAIETAFGVDRTVPLIVCTGDSLTHGFFISAGSVDPTNTYPSQLQTQRPGSLVINDGIYGQNLTQMISRAAVTNAMWRTGGKLVVLAGTNTMGQGQSAATTLSSLATLIATFDAVWGSSNVYVGTIPDRQDLGAGQATYDSTRATVNTSIRSTYASRLIDFAADPLIGDVGASNNTTLFQADKCHFTAAGHAVNMAAVDAVI